jgi:hypothetical protein
MVITDGSCNGLQWWAFPTTTTDGYLKVMNMTNGNLNMPGYQYSGTYNNDFGCGYTGYFFVNNPYTGVTDLAGSRASIEVYPNPAQNVVNVDLSGMQHVNGTIQLMDIMGRVLYIAKCDEAHKEINVSRLSNGVYTIQFVDDAGNKLQTKLLINK